MATNKLMPLFGDRALADAEAQMLLARLSQMNPDSLEFDKTLELWRYTRDKRFQIETEIEKRLTRKRRRTA